MTLGFATTIIMNTNIAVSVALIFLSALFTVILTPTVVFLAGVVVCIVAALKFRSQKLAGLKLGNTALFRSGLAILAGAFLASFFVLAAMSGLFAR
jgi:hypothetical protein